VSPTECARSKYALIRAPTRAKCVFTHPHPLTFPMCVSLGSVQLRCEAGAARRWPGSRAAYLIASVTASRPLLFASRSSNSSAATAAPLRLRHAELAAQLTPLSVRQIG
jgi:hypothetical protein